METKNLNAECPICKNPISRENLIPIYVKDENAKNTDRFKIPNRPKGQRSEANPNFGNNVSNFIKSLYNKYFCRIQALGLILIFSGHLVSFQCLVLI